jgi:hypothetical protein
LGVYDIFGNNNIKNNGMNLEDKKAELKVVCDSCRIFYGWQRDISEKAGISRELLKHMIEGKTPTIESDNNLLKMSKVIDISRNYFFSCRKKAESLSKIMKQINTK